MTDPSSYHRPAAGRADTYGVADGRAEADRPTAANIAIVLSKLIDMGVSVSIERPSTSGESSGRNDDGQWAPSQADRTAG